MLHNYRSGCLQLSAPCTLIVLFFLFRLVFTLPSIYSVYICSNTLFGSFFDELLAAVIVTGYYKNYDAHYNKTTTSKFLVRNVYRLKIKIKINSERRWNCILTACYYLYIFGDYFYIFIYSYFSAEHFCFLLTVCKNRYDWFLWWIFMNLSFTTVYNDRLVMLFLMAFMLMFILTEEEIFMIRYKYL